MEQTSPYGSLRNLARSIQKLAQGWHVSSSVRVYWKAEPALTLPLDVLLQQTLLQMHQAGLPRRGPLPSFAVLIAS